VFSPDFDRKIQIQKMSYPKISIVTPSFNQAEFLEQTICSVLDQSYPNLEYVVIDGGSTDGSVEIIKKYEDKISYWVSEKDEGQYFAINKGFSHTSGDIMGWLNSSDIYYPWTFRIIAEIFESNKEIKWISGMPTHLNSGNAPQNISYGRERNIYDIICGKYKWLQQESIFWKRNLWNQVGGELNINIKYAGDFDLWLKFFQHTSLYYVNTILGGFRYHDIRRGYDIHNTYLNEAEKLFKEFKSQLPFKTKLQASIIRRITYNSSLKNFFKKLHIIKWYHYKGIYYDFSNKRWTIRTY